MSFITYVDEYPPCDFCTKHAIIDSDTIYGHWANLCSLCWLAHTNHQIGTGKAQLLVKRGANTAYDDADLKALEYLEGLADG